MQSAALVPVRSFSASYKSIFGRIFAGQNVSPSLNYTDTVTATISF